ncbi:MAG: alpha/beta fold hydrolase [Phycisphaera sp.]|nr:alpha/beta fold hydrolase [Phycisphaera sp.]
MSPQPHPLAVATARAALRWPRYSIGNLARGPVRLWAQTQGGQSFTAPTLDNAHIGCLHVPAQRSTDNAQTRKPAVVLVHGYFETKEFHLRHAAMMLRMGHDVLLMDLRNHGLSSHSAVTFGHREKHDLAAVIDEAQKRNLIGDRVVTFGYSLGASTVLQHAPDDKRVQAVIALAPFFDMRRAVRSFRKLFAPWMDHAWLMRGIKEAARQEGFDIDDTSTLDAFRRIDVPVLIAAGDKDRHLPATEHTHQLVAQTRRENIRFVNVPGATHLTIYRRRQPVLDGAITVFMGELDRMFLTG